MSDHYEYAQNEENTDMNSFSGMTGNYNMGTGSSGIISDQVDYGGVYSSQATNIDQLAQDLLQLNSSLRQDAGEYRITGSGYESQSYSTNSGVMSSVLSSVEQAILRSQVPIEINESEEITVNGQRGVWANKAEVFITH